MASEELPGWFTNLSEQTITKAKEYHCVLQLFDLSRLEAKAHTNYHGINDYKKFLAIRAALPGLDTDLSPTDDIDAVWHAHILDTVSYHRCCGALVGAGNLIHHNPYTSDDVAMRQERRKLLKKLWAQVFESDPALGWGVDPSACENYIKRLTGRKRRRRSGDAYQIFVRGLRACHIITLMVESDTEVEDVKLMLYDRDEAPLENMRLIYAGTQLVDGKTMSDYKIRKESTLHLVLRMAGC
jgi:large subunit ribosomal protein L40e/small subunit ribosomal protein S27Ae/ubiquitin C